MKIITILFMLFVVVGLSTVGSIKKRVEGIGADKASEMSKRAKEAQKGPPCKGIVDLTGPLRCVPCPAKTTWNEEKKTCVNRCSPFEPAKYWNSKEQGCRTLDQMSNSHKCTPPMIYRDINGGSCACPKDYNWNKNTKNCEADVCFGTDTPRWDNNTSKCARSLMG